MDATKTAGYITLGDGRIYYETTPGAGEPLVLVHGGIVDSRMWDAQVDGFAPRFPVIRYDMRGMGRSDPATGPISRRDELRGVLDALQVERAALVGWSLGGEVALDFALEAPDRVTALVLVSAVPGGFAFEGQPPQAMLEMIAAMQQGDLERASALQLRLFLDGPTRQPTEVDPALRQRVTEMNRIVVANGTQGIADGEPLNPLDPPAARRLAEVRAPVLIIAGALDNPEIVRAADVMAAGIRGARKVIIPGAAHLLNMEQPQAFNRAVLDFLSGLNV